MDSFFVYADTESRRGLGERGRQYEGGEKESREPHPEDPELV